MLCAPPADFRAIHVCVCVCFVYGNVTALTQSIKDEAEEEENKEEKPEISTETNDIRIHTVCKLA